MIRELSFISSAWGCAMAGSHRDFSLAYWQNNQGMANLKNRNYPVASYSNLELGDAWVQQQFYFFLESKCKPHFFHLPRLRTISLSGIALNRTIHHGWTLHWAPEQPASQPPRAAWTVSYFADGARILQTKHARYDFTHICCTPNSYALLSCICALHSSYPLTQWDILSVGRPL